MLLRIDHETRLTYTEPVSESVIELRMAPPSDEMQTVLHYRLRTTPPAPVTGCRDGFGNRVDLFNVLAAHRDIAVCATSFVRTHRRPGPERLAAGGVRDLARGRRRQSLDVVQDVLVRHSSPALIDLATLAVDFRHRQVRVATGPVLVHAMAAGTGGYYGWNGLQS